MLYKAQYISIDTPNSRRPGIDMQPEYITIHSTGNLKSSAQNERDWLVSQSNNRIASWHIVVDDQEAIEAIPLNEIAWHAGDGKNGIGNRKSISIEICESNDREKSILNAVKIVATILIEKNWNVNCLRRHYDWSGKHCPRIFSSNDWEGWNNFKLLVEKEVKELSMNQWSKEAIRWATSPEVNLTDGLQLKEPLSLERMITILYKYDKLKEDK